MWCGVLWCAVQLVTGVLGPMLIGCAVTVESFCGSTPPNLSLTKSLVQKLASGPYLPKYRRPLLLRRHSSIVLVVALCIQEELCEHRFFTANLPRLEQP